MYRYLITNIYSPPTSLFKWNKSSSRPTHKWWIKHNLLHPFSFTWFTNTILWTNVNIIRWNLQTAPRVFFCKEHNDKIIEQLWYQCRIMWGYIFDVENTVSERQFILSPLLICVETHIIFSSFVKHYIFEKGGQHNLYPCSIRLIIYSKFI